MLMSTGYGDYGGHGGGGWGPAAGYDDGGAGGGAGGGASLMTLNAQLEGLVDGIRALHQSAAERMTPRTVRRGRTVTGT